MSYTRGPGPLQGEHDKLKAAVGIVEDGDTATNAIAKGQYVIWKDDLYIAKSDIQIGATLNSASGGNMTAKTNGLGGEVAALNSITALQDITPSNVSDFFTPKSGITMSNLSIKKKNGISYVSCWIKRNTSWSPTEPLDIGTIQPNYRACVSVPIATFDFFGLFSSEGGVILKPHNTIQANTNYDLIFSYSDNN